MYRPRLLRKAGSTQNGESLLGSELWGGFQAVSLPFRVTIDGSECMVGDCLCKVWALHLKIGLALKSQEQVNDTETETNHCIVGKNRLIQPMPLHHWHLRPHDSLLWDLASAFKMLNSIPGLNTWDVNINSSCHVLSWAGLTNKTMDYRFFPMGLMISYYSISRWTKDNFILSKMK